MFHYGMVGKRPCAGTPRGRTGEDVDVVEVRDQTFAQFSNNGWIAPLNEYVEGWEGMVSRFLP